MPKLSYLRRLDVLFAPRVTKVAVKIAEKNSPTPKQLWSVLRREIMKIGWFVDRKPKKINKENTYMYKSFLLRP